MEIRIEDNLITDSQGNQVRTVFDVNIDEKVTYLDKDYIVRAIGFKPNRLVVDGRTEQDR